MSKGIGDLGKRLTAYLVVLMVALVSAGCAGQAGDTGPLKVGFMGPITGEYSVWGEDHLAAAQLAVDEWNERGGVLGRQIELVPADSQGDGTQAAALANQFVDQGIEFVIGPTFSNEAETTVPIFGPNQILSVTGLADLMDEAGSEGYYRTSLREDLSVKFAKRLLLEYLGGSRIAIIDDGKSDTVRSARLLEQYLGEEGVEPIFTGSVTSGEQNYAPTLTQIRSLEPDIIFLATVNPESALLRKQGEELGIEAVWVLAAGSVEDLFTEIAGESGVPSYSYEATRVGDRFGEFATNYEAENNRPPGNYNDYTYDAANVLLTAIENAGSTEYEAVKQALEDIESYPGVTGPIFFDETGSRGSEKYSVVEFGSDLEWHQVEDVPFDSPE